MAINRTDYPNLMAAYEIYLLSNQQPLAFVANGAPFPRQLPVPWAPCLVLSTMLLAGTALCAPAAINVVAGRASIIDGDTIEVHGQRIRLEGIDAPESSQLCRRHGTSWHCGQQSAMELSEWVGSKPVTCSWSKHDRYGRALARCSASAKDLGGWLVRNGWAFAYVSYSKDYIAEEALGKQQSRGLWAGQFAYPWTWRKCRMLFGREAHCATVVEPTNGTGLQRDQAARPNKVTPVIASRSTSSPGVVPPTRYRNCAEAHAAGAAPVKRGQPGYGRHLDRNGDGVGC